MRGLILKDYYQGKEYVPQTVCILFVLIASFAFTYFKGVQLASIFVATIASLITILAVGDYDLESGFIKYFKITPISISKFINGKIIFYILTFIVNAVAAYIGVTLATLFKVESMNYLEMLFFMVLAMTFYLNYSVFSITLSGNGRMFLLFFVSFFPTILVKVVVYINRDFVMSIINHLKSLNTVGVTWVFVLVFTVVLCLAYIFTYNRLKTK